MVRVELPLPGHVESAAAAVLAAELLPLEHVVEANLADVVQVERQHRTVQILQEHV